MFTSVCAIVTRVNYGHPLHAQHISHYFLRPANNARVYVTGIFI